MNLFELLALLITLTALFAYLNHRFIGLPTTIGVMLVSLMVSLVVMGAGKLGLAGLEHSAEQVLRQVDFGDTLMHGMLSFLLFAGALHVNLDDLMKQRWAVGILASFGVVLSAFIVATLTWLLLPLLGLQLSFAYCLVFGALISPTDPIAVLGILKKVGVAPSIEAKIAGESLFNDGVAVVMFIICLQVATGRHEPTLEHIGGLFLKEAVGGVLFGLLIGAGAFWLLKSVDNYQVEVLITLALVSGGYAMADRLHISGPIAMALAGLLIGNHGRMLAMSEQTRHHLDTFWELVDEVLNGILFVLIGLEILLLQFTGEFFTAGLLLIPVVLLARLISVGLPIGVLRTRQVFSPGVVKILTWGGLRGGISVALALALPHGPERNLILAVTYIVVVFSIVVQGLSVGRVVRASAR